MVRRGRRVGRPRLVVHALTADRHAENENSMPIQAGQPTARVGFVVSKAVGNSVLRHRVTRRLRHLMADRLGTLPPHCALVVRALPSSAAASSSELGADLDGALRRLNLTLSGDVA